MQSLKGTANTLAGYLLIPHEVAHYLVLAPWSESLEIVINPDEQIESQSLAAAHVTGSFADNTPITAIRMSAIAPLIYLPIAWGLVPFLTGLGTYLTMAFLSPILAQSGLSKADCSTFLNAGEVRSHGAFDSDIKMHRHAKLAWAINTLGLGVLITLIVIRAIYLN